MRAHAPVTRLRTRRAERLLLFSAALWSGAMAVVTLFPYQMWFTSVGYEALEAADAAGASGAVTEVVAVIRLYGIAVLLGALVTALVAWRMGPGHSRGVTWWLLACVAATFLTRDVVSVLLFSVCLAVYLSRSRAMRRIDVTEPATSPDRTEQTEEV